jgi:hypothetical protein
MAEYASAQPKYGPLGSFARETETRKHPGLGICKSAGKVVFFHGLLKEERIRGERLDVEWCVYM